MNLKEEIRYECIVESEEKDERNLLTLTFNSGNGCIRYKKVCRTKNPVKLPIVVKRCSLHQRCTCLISVYQHAQ